MATSSDHPDRPTPSDDTRVTLRLSPNARDAVEEIKKLGGFSTIQEAVRRAIGDELFLLREQKRGWKILLQKDDNYREVIWPST